MAKQRVEEAEPEENTERWVVTYADMITLLLAFFIMMYAMSRLNEGKFQKVARSVKVELGVESTGALVVSVPGASGTGNAGILAGDIAGVLEQRLGDSVVGDNLEVLSGPDSVTIRLRTGELFFERGSAKLQWRLRKTLAEIAKLIKPLACEVRIEGHTCDLPIHTQRYPSNWELSAQRAINVLTYLTHYGGLPAKRLSATGYADTRPVVPNIAERARKRNRRVDIVLLNIRSAPRVRSVQEAAPAEVRAPAVAVTEREDVVTSEGVIAPVSLAPAVDLAPLIDVTQ